MNTSAKPHLALIEDNEDLREELVFFLQASGYSCWGCASAETFWKNLHTRQVDIVLIDLGLPGEDGFEVVDYLNRLPGVGRIIITARGTPQDRLRCLQLGADLYLVKPINFAELRQQLDALWDRMAVARMEQETSMQAGEWRLDAVQSCLTSPNGQVLKVSRKECDLLATLLGDAGQIHTRESLHDALFGTQDEADLHRIDVILSRLRKKARNQQMLLPLRSVFGKGIVFLLHGQ